MRTTLTILAVLTLALTASAMPVTWTLTGIVLNGGVATATGSFTFDADAGTACSTTLSPCGTFSNVDITTSLGGGLPAETFLYTCGTDVPTCTGASPDSTEALFLTSTNPNQTGMVALAFFFTE